MMLVLAERGIDEKIFSKSDNEVGVVNKIEKFESLKSSIMRGTQVCFINKWLIFSLTSLISGLNFPYLII